jgi:hypothetical protein
MVFDPSNLHKWIAYEKSYLKNSNSCYTCVKLRVAPPLEPRYVGLYSVSQIQDDLLIISQFSPINMKIGTIKDRRLLFR